MGDKFGETVKELLSEIDELGYSSSERVEYSDTLESGRHLELESAEEEGTPLESLANLFEGFGATSSTPSREGVSRVSSLVKNFETLQVSSDTKPKKLPKKQTETKRRYHTRTVAEEDSSPFTSLPPKKRKTAITQRKLQFGKMALANILNAKRLNPQVRKAGDQTLAKVGFKILLKDEISNHGRIVMKQLDAVRLRIAKDPNLVIAEGADTTTALSLVVE